MSLLANFFRRRPAPKPVRRYFAGATVSLLVGEALVESACANFRVLLQKDRMAAVTPEELHALALRVHMPWCPGVWECEDIARNLVNEAQKIAANEGCSWAVGTLRARPPGWDVDSVKADLLHVYVWFITPGGRAEFYDPTACKLVHEDDVLESDYALT